MCSLEFDRIKEIFVRKFLRFSLPRQLLKYIVKKVRQEETITETAYFRLPFKNRRYFASVRDKLPTILVRCVAFGEKTY